MSRTFTGRLPCGCRSYIEGGYLHTVACCAAHDDALEQVARELAAELDVPVTIIEDA